MGQQHSMAAKGNGIPGLKVPSLDGGHDSPVSFPPGHSTSQDRGPPTSGPSSSTNPVSLSGNIGVDQTQSVRAAIDSFIETCLAGGGDEAPSAAVKGESEVGAPKSVEIITVPDEDGSEDLNVDVTDQDSSNASGGGADSVDIRSKKSHKGQEVESVKTSGERQPELSSVREEPVVVSCEREKGSDFPDGFPAQAVSNSGHTEDKTSETPKVISPPPLHPVNTKTNKEESTNSNLETKHSREANDSSNSSSDGDGMASMRLKTIIDRVLDNSLGGGIDVKNIPYEQCILPQIISEGQSAPDPVQGSRKAASGEGETEEKKGVGEGHQDRLMEPVAICFMEHIEKAVERSFSSITEEEERKEKDKAFTSQVTKGSESKPASQSSWQPKASEAPIDTTPTTSEGTAISVQDIVDRVISQTEVISKLMTTSAGTSSTVDSKPVVSAAGTFYPDRAPLDSSSHHSLHRQDTHRDDIPREAPSRRGRPKMRPYADRDMAVHPNRHGHAAHRGLTGAAPEDYIQSMQASLAKYGQVPPSHRMPPYLPSVTQASSVHNAMVAAAMGGLHSGAPLHQQHPHHSLVTQHASSPVQPPPLLRVSGVERADHPPPPPHAQGKILHHHHPHPPSKTCGCSACAMYLSDGERLRMMQQQHQGTGEKSVPRMSPHSPHHPYPKVSSAAQPHALKWPGADVRHQDLKPEKGYPHYPFSAYPSHSQSARGPDPYPGAHPAYGIQSSVPVPHLPYPEKPVPESRHSEPSYSKGQERGDYQHRRTQPGYEEPAPGPLAGNRHPYPNYVAPAKPVGGPGPLHHYQVPHPHPNARGQSGQKVEDPVVDAAYRRDRPVAQPPPAEVVEDDKPLDLSAKKLMPFSDQPDNRQREDYRHFDGRQAQVDPHGYGASHLDRTREGDRGLPASQHLHNLENSVETYFQKFQPHASHRGVPAQNIAAGTPPQSISVGRPHQSAGGRGSTVPLPPHHPTRPPQHHSPAVPQSYTSTSQPNSYPAEPMLSPGGRRPQLHPIPAPNPSTSLGSTAPRVAPGFQSRPGTSSIPMAPGVPSLPMVSVAPGVNSSSVVSVPPSLPPAPAPVSSPQRVGSGGGGGGGGAYPGDMHAMGSRSVSPPAGNDARLEERRRGSVSKHEPIQNIIGNNNPQDILYLICRLCRQTYGSQYGFRKHFRNQHGFEPKAEHTLVQTISATKNARQMSGGLAPSLDPGSPSQEAFVGKLPVGNGAVYNSHTASPQPELLRSVPAESSGSRGFEPVDEPQSGKGDSAEAPVPDFKRSGSLSRLSVDSKGRSPSGSASGGSVGGEEREDTKCLECPECGQTFQLNDFGSYKRHCRQHGQMRGVQGGAGSSGGGGGGSQGAYACPDCHCTFPEHNLLQEHMLRHQSHTAVCVCHICHASFRSPAQCQEHVYSVHGQVAGESFSSSPSSVGAKPFAASAPSNADISSTSSVKRQAVSADSSMSFNLKVTTPSDLEIRRLPADPIVTSASPDSSSDNNKGQDNSDGRKGQDGSPVSSSEQNKDSGKREYTPRDSPKSMSSDVPDMARVAEDRLEREKSAESSKLDSQSCPLSKSGSSSMDSSSSSSAVETDVQADLFMYKHKKFSAHRKRLASNETAASDAKQACLSTDRPVGNRMQQNVVSSASDKPPAQQREDKPKAEEEKGVAVQKASGSKTEARHQMPFVWDRVTRSQAGKNARSADYS